MQGFIFVFGGGERKLMIKLSEEGALLDDLSEDPRIPRDMCEETFVVQNDKIYVVGSGEREDTKTWYRGLQSFNGKTWSFI